jgi:hypothetical protein
MEVLVQELVQLGPGEIIRMMLIQSASRALTPVKSVAELPLPVRNARTPELRHPICI